jgi:riboflavin synthase
MFTGIITDIGTVHSIENKAGDWRIAIRTNFDLSKTEIGASIACAGCCLTVVEKTGSGFYVDVSNETLSKTNIGSWAAGSKINLEQALKMGDELGGHIVSGHVDGLATVKSIQAEGDSWRLVFESPEKLAGMIAPKGSVALDGVSLTVNEVNETQFGVNIIPHTWKNTTFGDLQEGQTVHLEVDMLARYVARALAYNKS